MDFAELERIAASAVTCDSLELDRPARARLPQPLTCLCPCRGDRFDVRRLRAYCGPRCSSEAQAVRYLRAAHQRFAGQPPEDVRQACAMKVAHALGGGYDGQARRLGRVQRQQILVRDRYQCVLCGASDQLEVDHLGGPSNVDANLRTLCRSCHVKVTRAHFRRVVDPAMEIRRRDLLRRVATDQPLRPCDQASWETSWREWAGRHATYS